MRNDPSLLGILLILFHLVGSGAAQAPRPAVQSPPIGLGVGAGLQAGADGLLGFGTDYKATFADGRLVYTPMLGKAAPHDLPLTMEVSHVGRGELTAVGPATTTRRELRIDFERTELRERLDVLPGGLKQSFVFAALPPGDGDLVVRARIDTELRAERARSDGALRFLAAGCGGVEIGQVVGIDADGRRTTGWLRTDGATLDFVLPAAFVAAATLPLVVDPLLSSVIVTAASGDDRQPAVYPIGAPFNTYLVAWLRASSATNNDVRAQRVHNGAVFGSLLTLESSSASAESVRVVDSLHTYDWFVCWQQAGDVVGVFIDMSGIPGPTIGVATGANVQSAPSLGGGLLGGLPHIVCVWRDGTANAIKGCKIDAMTQTAGAEVTLATGGLLNVVGQPTVSPTNPAARLLVNYVTTSTTLGGSAVRGIVVTSTLNVLVNPFPIAGSASVNATAPSCAGDSTRWVVAYNTSGPLGPGLACVPIERRGAQAFVGSPRTLAGANGAAHNAAVTWFGDSAMIAFSSSNGATNDVALHSVDPFTCADCEGTLQVDVAGNDGAVALTTRFGTVGSINEGALAYTPLTAGAGDVVLQLLFARDGDSLAMGGACADGRLFAPCARAGNAGFRVELRDGPPNELMFVAHSTGSFGVSGFPCGPCSVVPDTTIGLIHTLGVSSPLGAIGAPLPLPAGPAVIGADVYSQFFCLGGPCLGLVKLTEALRFTLE